MSRGPVPRSLEARFADKVDTSPGHGPRGECHVFTGSKDGCGYGMLRVDRQRVRRAHIVAWFLATGEWPALPVLHRCDTPACVRKACLFLGTRAENNADRDAKRRHIALRGSDHGNARLTEDAVRMVRASSRSGADLAAELGVSQTTLSRARSGLTWKHVGGTACAT